MKGQIEDSRQRNAAALFGLWLVLVIVKFGNPVIFASRRDAPGSESLDPLGAPGDIFEFLIAAWPISWSYAALGLLGVAALFVGRWKMPGPKWLLVLPLAWFGWQLVSATQTVDGDLTRVTLLQFAGCLVCFWAGLCGLSEVRDLRPVWWGLGAALVIVLWTALDQHLGGLERTRLAFEQLPDALRARLDTPEFRVKLASTRVFGTFVYPNALAGGILLLLPATLAGLGSTVRHPGLRRTLVGVLAAAGAASLYWSGSKSGWLIAIALGALALWRAGLKPVLKFSLLGGLLAAGLLAFFGRHSGYFEKGATSLTARGDYWQAARQMIARRPLLGYGPGTFQIQYRALKSPEAEMAKLAHNDYLQQGCDAGLPALAAYGIFIAGSLYWLRPRRRSAGLRSGAPAGSAGAPDPSPVPMSGARRFAVWLGAVGFAVQSGVEFGLYIPALAWPFFLFLGWLWGSDDANDRGAVQIV